MSDDTLYKIGVSRMAMTKKLPYGDPLWRNFNASFENRTLESMDIVDAIYAGYPITTWHKDHWRTSENYICGQHLGLDFDHGGDMATLAKDKFISKYASFLYTTISHTEEEPRCRAIFLLDTPIMQAKNYTLAASALLWMFGTADRQCKDAVRFFYGAKGCKFTLLGNVLPIELIKRLIANYLETGVQEKRQAVNKNYTAPASQQEVADALKFIRPWDIDYDEWVSILMAIHSQFGNAGLGLAESWGDGKPNEVADKWKSFDANGNTSGVVTIATVFGIAKRYGWRKNNGGL